MYPYILSLLAYVSTMLHELLQSTLCFHVLCKDNSIQVDPTLDILSQNLHDSIYFSFKLAALMTDQRSLVVTYQVKSHDNYRVTKNSTPVQATAFCLLLKYL